MRLPFTLRQLEVFDALQASKSFTTTADEFGISQAAVSQHIQAMEQAVGTALFVRHPGRRPALTPAGQALAQDISDFRRVAEKLASHRRDKLDVSGVAPFRVFVGPVLLELFIKPKIDKFSEAHPNIQLDIESDYVDLDMIDRFTSGPYDLVIYNHTAAYHSAISADRDRQSRVIASFNAGIFAHRTLIEDVGPVQSPDILGSLPFVLWRPSKGVRIDQRTALERAGIYPNNVVARTQYYEVFLKMVERGVGAGLTSECFLAEESKSDLKLCWPVSPTHLMIRRREGLATDARLDLVEQFMVSSIVQDVRFRTSHSAMPKGRR